MVGRPYMEDTGQWGTHCLFEIWANCDQLAMFFLLSGECNTMNIRPLQDRLIVQRLEKEELSAGGIVLPDSAKEKPMRGKVVAKGPGKMMDSGNVVALSVEVGEEVLFGKYSGTEVTIEDVEYVVMREEDIMGVID